MKIVIVLIWAIGLSVCFFGVLSATTINVPSDQPTIQAGIDAAVNGDIVLVAPGTYVRNLNFMGKKIVLTSSGGREVTFIEPNDPNYHIASFISNEDTNCVIEGFTIRNSENGYGIYCNSSSPKIQNCEICNCNYGGDGAGIWYQNSGGILRNNLIHNNVGGSTGGGVGGQGSQALEIAHNVIYNNAAANGVSIGFIGATSNKNIHHNTIYGNYGGGYVSGLYINGTNSLIHNNTIHNNTRGVTLLNGSGIDVRNNIIVKNTNEGLSPVTATYDYNDVWSNGSANNPGPNGISADPLFVALPDNTCALQELSPCIDAGDPDPQYNDPDGTRNDIGALYYNQAYSGPLWYVSILGNDETGDGSLEFPYATIQKGIDLATSGDTVFIMNGTYIGPGNRNLVMKNKAISIIGEGGPDSVIIDVENSGLDGLKMTADLEITGPINIENLSIIRAVNGIIFYNEYWLIPEQLIISNSAFNQCSEWGIKAESSIGIIWQLSNCLFSNNESGLKLINGELDSCIFENNINIALDILESANLSGNQFSNNSIAFYRPFRGNLGEAYISNTIFNGNETAIYGSAIATNCDFFGHSNAVIRMGSYVVTEITNSRIINNFGDIANLGSLSEDDPGLYINKCIIMDNYGGIRGYESPDNHYYFQMDSCIYARNSNPILMNQASFWGAKIYNCSFIANDSGAIYCKNLYNSLHRVTDCIFYDNDKYAIRGDTIPDLPSIYVISCNDFYNNEIDFIGIHDQIGLNGNISRDPRFCDITSDSLFIASNSPCAPENNSCSTLIGAFPVGCGEIYKTYYVSIAGSDSTGIGSYEKPFMTVQRAVNDAVKGDTVMVMAGTYPEHIVIKKGITLSSSDGSDATILSGTPGHRVITLDYATDTVRINGFSITGGNPTDDAVYGEYGGGLLSVYSLSIIENCEIYGNNAPDTGNGDGLSYRDWSYCKIINCHIHDNSSNTDGGGVMISDPAGGVVMGNIIENNQSNNNCGGLYIDAFEYWYRWIYVTNNTIVNNVNGSQGAGIQVRKVNGYLHNNIVAFNFPYDSALYDGSHAVWASLCTLNVDCNDLYGNKGNNDYNLIDVDLIASTTVPGLNDLFLNPLFCYPDTGNYNIYSSSPCAPDNNNCGTLIGALDIGCINFIPEIVSSPEVEVYEDSLLVYRVAYFDPDGPDTIITFYDYPSWLIPDADSIYGIPTEGIGDTSFMVTVSDGYNSDTLEVLIDVIPVNDPPVIIPIDPQVVYEGNHLEFVMYSSDVDNMTLYLSVENPPENSDFIDSGNGNGLFTFDPDIDQAGVYNILFIVNDGELADSETVEITVYDSDPVIQQVIIDGQTEPTHVINNAPLIEWVYTDPLESKAQTKYEIAVGDDNDWTYAEMWNPAPVQSSDTFVVYNGSPLIDGATYYLRLRVHNGEVWSSWYYTSFHMNSVPSIPVLSSPIADVIVTDVQPFLYLQNSTDAETDDTLTYEFVVANDTTFGEPDPIYEDGITEGTDSTGWQVTEPLNENWHYFWSARAFDQYEYSEWSESQTFWVNAVEEAPSAFQANYPPDTGYTHIVDMLTNFWWVPSQEYDPLDSVYYTLCIALDSNFNFVNTIDSIWATEYTLTPDDSLSFGTRYWWKVKATDNTGRFIYSANRPDFRTWMLGDANGDNSVNILDATFLISYLYKGGNAPYPAVMGDINGSCSTNILDVTYLINYLYKSGPVPMVGCG